MTLTHLLALVLAHPGASQPYPTPPPWGIPVEHGPDLSAPYPNSHGIFFAKSAFSVSDSRS